MSPYTSQVQQKIKLSEGDLKKVQFFLSGDIILFRTLSGSETEITQGEIKIVNGEKIEEIIIKDGTPGIITNTEDADKFFVSFDTDGSYLLFGPNQEFGGRYTLMAKEWQGRTGIIEYAGKLYKATPASIYAYLEVNMHQIDNSTVVSKEAEGRTVMGK
jgi:hypothetical protein